MAVFRSLYYSEIVQLYYSAYVYIYVKPKHTCMDLKTALLLVVLKCGYSVFSRQEHKTVSQPVGYTQCEAHL